MRQYANKQNWHHSKNSYRESVLMRHTIWGTIWSYRSAWRSCPCTSSLVSPDEYFNRTESGYQLEATASSSQENMDLSDSSWYWNVTTRLLGCLHSSWPWKRDTTVSEDYALMMLIITPTQFYCQQIVFTFCVCACMCTCMHTCWWLTEWRKMCQAAVFTEWSWWETVVKVSC